MFQALLLSFTPNKSAQPTAYTQQKLQTPWLNCRLITVNTIKVPEGVVTCAVNINRAAPTPWSHIMLCVVTPAG
jgi:hypothetical protein